MLMQDRWPNDLVPSKVNQNPRSTTGILVNKEDLQGPQFHFKRFDSEEALERESSELRRALIRTKKVEHVQPIKVRNVEFEHRLLITEYIDDGESLFNYIWNGSRWWKRSAFGRCGAADLGKRLAIWLAAYHTSTTSSQPSPVAVLETVIDQVRRKLALAEQETNCISTTLAENLRHYLDATEAMRDTWCYERTSHIHGDFVIGNMLIDSHGMLFVLDFADARVGFPREDFVRLWHEIWTISRLSPRRRRLLQPCLDALIDNYSISIDVQKDPLSLLLRCWNAVCNIRNAALSSRQIGFTATLASRRLAKVNARWLESVDWQMLSERCS